MPPYQFLQHHRPDEVGRTAPGVAPVVGAYKVVLPPLKIIRGAVTHFRPAVGAVDKAGEYTALAGFRPPVPLLAYLLHLVKDFCLDDGRVGVVEDGLPVLRAVPLLLVPDRVGVGLEIDGAARVLPPLQNVDNGVWVPVAGVGPLLVGGLAALPVLVGRGGEYPRFRQRPGDLHRPPPLHAEGEDTLDHLCRFLVHKPALRGVGVFLVAVGDIRCQRLPALPLGLVHRPDLPAGVPRVKLVEPVFDSGKVVVHAVRVDGVVVVVDGDKPHAILGKGDVGVHPRQGGIAAKPGQVFDDTHGHMAGLDLVQHFLKSGPLEARPAVTVIHEKHGVGEAVIPRVLLQNALLESDLSRVFSPRYITLYQKAK